MNKKEFETTFDSFEGDLINGGNMDNVDIVELKEICGKGVEKKVNKKNNETVGEKKTINLDIIKRQMTVYNDAGYFTGVMYVFGWPIYYHEFVALHGNVKKFKKTVDKYIHEISVNLLKEIYNAVADENNCRFKMDKWNGKKGNASEFSFWEVNKCV